jgi:hypothetical protein
VYPVPIPIKIENVGTCGRVKTNAGKPLYSQTTNNHPSIDKREKWENPKDANN